MAGGLGYLGMGSGRFRWRLLIGYRDLRLLWRRLLLLSRRRRVRGAVGGVALCVKVIHLNL